MPPPVAPVRQDWMREHNLSLALSAVLEAAEPVSRAQVAALTGLSRAAVTNLVDRLVEAGLVRELAPVALPRGRPAVPLVPVGQAVAGLGLEVNVDYLGVRALDLTGAVIAEQVVHGDLRGSEPAEVAGRLSGVAARVRDAAQASGARVAGATLALPGLLDSSGVLRTAPNLGWRDLDAVALLPPGLVDGPAGFTVANEADLAARAEIRARITDDEKPSFFYVSGEIGIGGARVLGGELSAGRHGWAGEIGHVVVGSSGGSLIRLEDVAGQRALLHAAGLPAGAGAAELAAAVTAGSRRALDAVAAAGRALGIALAAVAHISDVDQVVLGGTFSALFDQLAGPVGAALAELVVFSDWAPVRVDRARAGDYAALTGAAHTVIDRLVARPSLWLNPGPAA
ncbi:ROK family transcriptional regulator [Kineosporia sp. J2-2]|uniref:ROK family transcriptional regulator n=1 Tax=Kineosporia corallincola TaxID=2835133 RepID=A0ABS5THL0_9ACTN|nr:ROK family transcriptional regulator [Kineosporia corallincola]MBT0770584.1 ROK family transcriptional regulator [Kineosporia corallincola]